MNQGKWRFFADRGGTFTDVVGITPNGQVAIAKVLSENPQQYQDAVIEGIRQLMGVARDEPIPSEDIEVVKIGTTIATNALLERKGEPTLLIITQGFKDALRIAYQNRPDLFALKIVLPELLYQKVIEVEERYTALGSELKPVNLEKLRPQLASAYQEGIRSCAIVLLHSYRYPEHENQVAQLAQEIGFSQISLSHQGSPLIKLVSRGDTTVVDAYLSPVLRRYVEQVSAQLQGTPVMFMQSNGGLIEGENFQGRNSILSGPAGGIVGAVQTSLQAGFDRIITFDMGGTSTDVAHFKGEYERQWDTEVAGVRLRSPMMAIHTVAAGGGSILSYDGSCYRVGPSSAGALPGPACYRQGGPLTVTDANLMLGKIQPQFFPKIFGPKGDLPLDQQLVREKFCQLTEEIGDNRSAEQVATGFIEIAVANMANAIKKISLGRGYDLSEYTLCCFGGAGGQHACLLAESLGIKQVLIHPYAGVLSAYGIGLADVRVIKQQSVEAELKAELIEDLVLLAESLAQGASSEISNPGDSLTTLIKVNLKYQGTDSALLINFDSNLEVMKEEFVAQYFNRYGFQPESKPLVVDSVMVELIKPGSNPVVFTNYEIRSAARGPKTTVQLFSRDRWHTAPVFERGDLQPGDLIVGPALILEQTGSNVLEVGWQAEVTAVNNLVLSPDQRQAIAPLPVNLDQPDPVRLEIFKNLFQFIAEEMGIALQNTASSVNIKERLDFSCAIFDGQGNLVANAPHIPVHLGSMSESVRSLITAKGTEIKSGDVYISNNPYNGGTHLPDVTVITPVFDSGGKQIMFYLASRGHQGDIGGVVPGSMPPHSTSLIEEGILLDNFPLVLNHQFQEPQLRAILASGPYPARNPDQNIQDFQAQIAANNKGKQELLHLVDRYGLATVEAYMGHVQNHGEEAVRRVIAVLKDGEFSYAMDQGGVIRVKVTIDPLKRQARIDFSGTSAQLANNFNAPRAVCQAAVLYVFRTLVEEAIPLNGGCLRPLELVIPPGSMLNPQYPGAVVAGNVETSQTIVDCLYGALGVMAASQGTMNNFTFGNHQYQYYETICGGSGAGPNFSGTNAVHTHMTNSRLTDPEVLESRYPVIVEEFSLRPGSGGRGQYRGGDGVVRAIRFQEKMTAAILSGHRVIPPFGLSGGDPGVVGRNLVRRASGSWEVLASVAQVEMEPGDVFVIETPGGGGFGTYTTTE